MPHKDSSRRKEYQREYYRRNREERNKYNRIYYRKLWEKIIKRLGGKCVYCGCNILNALEINHKHGGGRQEMKDRRKTFLLDIQAGRRPIDDLEIVCGICNAWHRLTKLLNIPDGWTIQWSQQNL